MTTETFEDLGLSADTAEALSAEGIETPTALQASAIPVIRRGNPFVGFAGPGAGVLVAFGPALLERLAEDEAEKSRLLVLCPDDEAAGAYAGALARIAIPSPVDVGAFAPNWAPAHDARVVFGTPKGVMAEVQNSALALDDFAAAVVVGGATAAQPETSALIELLPAGGQRVLIALPRDEATQAFASQYVKKAITYPPATRSVTLPNAAARTLEYQIAPEPRDQALIAITRQALAAEGTHRVVIWFRTDDQAADVGDLLELYGYPTGSAGDEDVRIWLAPPGSEGPGSFTGLHSISYQVPADRESLLHRHEHPERSTVLVASRELPHLRQLAASAGLKLLPAKPLAVSDPVIETLAGRIREGTESGALAPHLLTVEKLAAEHDPLEIAAAALWMALDSGARAAAEPVAIQEEGVRAPTRPVDAFVRLFLSIGSKDGVRPGDLLGAITGESGVEGSAIGKIEIRDSFSLIEVPGASADRVIRSLNGTTVRGRSVRADYDRQSARRKRSR